MAALLIRELCKHNIEFVVAPFEADAQMAWLNRNSKVAAVITEDSDLLLFGCQRVLYKLDKEGFADEVCLDRLIEATELDFGAFSHSKFRHMCMLSGCDYLPSIHGMGLKTAYKYICRYPDINRVLQVMRAEIASKMPANYESDFAKAELTFLHQRVFDTDLKRIVHLNPLLLPLDFPVTGDTLDFLGPLTSDKVARNICEGRICPNTLVPFQAPPPIIMPQVLSIIEPATGESPLPFTPSIDKRSEAQFPTAPSTRSAIAAARLSLKRTYTVDAHSQKENYRPVPQSFAFGASSATLLMKGIPQYLPPPRAGKGFPSHVKKNSGAPLPLDSSQRSIREFFRTVNK